MPRANNLLDGEQEGGLRELAAVVAVLAVANGTDGEDNLDVGTAAAEQVNGAAEVVGTLIDAELLFLEEGCRPLLAVVDNLARLFQPVDVVGAEGDKGDTGFALVSFHGVQDRGGVIHRTEGVDGGAELVFKEALADAVGKTRADEEHLLARLYLKIRLRYINNSPKFHHYSLFTIHYSLA